MSENFEKIVLEKLEKIDRLESKIDKLDSKINKLEGKTDKLESKTDKLDGKIDKLEGKTDKLESNQADIKEQLNNLIFELKETQDVVKFNTSRIIELEHTFKDKIDALFDARSINDDKHKEFSKSINNLQEKTFDHGIRISSLENNLKKVKEA